MAFIPYPWRMRLALLPMLVLGRCSPSRLGHTAARRRRPQQAEATNGSLLSRPRRLALATW
jgi:hypothetical protein